MTACVNKKHSRRVAAAVSASLVGALTLGAAPAVAFAATEAPVEAQDSLTEAEAFSQGTVKITDGKDTSSDGTLSKTWDGNVYKPTVVSVTPKGDGVDPVTDVQTSELYKVYYTVADSKGNPTDTMVAEPVEAGTYCLVVEALEGSDYAGGKAYTTFSIKGEQLSGAAYFQGDDMSATGDFIYDAEPVDISFAVSGAKLVEGVDYTVKYYKAGEDWNNASLGSETAPTDVNMNNDGTLNRGYYAHLTGIGKYAGQTADVQFKVTPYVLTSSNVSDVYVPYSVGVTSSLPTAPTTVAGSSELAKKFKFDYGTTVVGGVNYYTPYINLVDPVADAKNITLAQNSVNVNVYKVANGVDFTYGNAAISDPMVIDLSKKETFRKAMLGATYGDDETDVTSEIDVVIKDANNKARTVNYVNKHAGTYTVTLTVKPQAPDYKYGGTLQFKLVVTSGTLDAATQLVVTYKGKVVTSVVDTWDNKDISGDIKTALYDGKTKLQENVDYKVSFTDADGDVVTELKSAGSYTMHVTSDKYVIENGDVLVTINKLEVAGLRIHAYNSKSDSSASNKAGMLYGINGKYALQYSGIVITPVLEFTTGERDPQGELKWETLDTKKIPGSLLNVEYAKDGKAVKQVKDRGDYTATVSASAAVESVNLNVTADAYDFTVASALTFIDVPEGTYYHDAIDQAYANGYIHGYANTNMFGPDNAITRGDVATVLFNMSNGAFSEDIDFAQDETGYVTGFSDVDGHAYYAKAIAWAKATGVVNGYADGLFRPDQPVTAQEFACMLANYARLTGEDVDSAEADLSAYPDGSKVADFARSSVEWAVAEDVMGNGSSLDPAGQISRGRVATMCVNYQPKKLDVKTN